MESEKEIVIIGAGAIGCSITYHLAKQGVPSQIIEKDSIAARASGKAVGVWSYPPCSLAAEGRPPSAERLSSVPVGSVSPWLEFFWLGYHRLPDVALEIQEKGGTDIQFGDLSWVTVALSEAEEEAYKASLSRMRGAGYHEGDWLDPTDLKALFPDINPNVRGGSAFPFLQVEPYRYTLGLAQAAEKMGANFRQGEVVGFRHKDSRVTSVTLATGTEVEADVFVLATGPWSSQVTSRLGKEIPVRINREQCLKLEVPQPLPPYSLCTSAGHLITPKIDGSVLLGHVHVADLQTDLEVSITTEETKSDMLEGSIDLLPGLRDAKLTEHRGDFEAYPPPPRDTQPVIGRLSNWENAYIATRFNTTGIMLSLGAGQCMAELIIAGGRIPDRIKHMMETLSPANIDS